MTNRHAKLDVTKQQTTSLLAPSEQGSGASRPGVRVRGTALKTHGPLEENSRAARAFPDQLGLVYHPGARRGGHPGSEYSDSGSH